MKRNFIISLAVLAGLAAALVVPAFAQQDEAPPVELSISLTDYHFTVAGQQPDQPLQLQAG